MEEMTLEFDNVIFQNRSATKCNNRGLFIFVLYFNFSKFVYKFQ